MHRFAWVLGCAALAGALPAMAEVEKTRLAPQLQAVDVSGRAEVQRLALRRFTSRPTNEKVGTWSQGMFCGGAKDIHFNEPLGKLLLGDFPINVRRELTAAGYPRPPESVFGTPGEREPLEYEIGAALTAVEMNVCGTPSEMEGNLWVRLRWELYSPRERRVTYSLVTEGSAQIGGRDKKPFLELQRLTIANATRNLLADAGFVDNVTRKAAAGPAAVTQAALPIARRATATQPIGDSMTMLQSAVVTLYTGIGSGSGFYIHRDGWLLTNQHVVGDAKFIKVKLANGRELVGEVVRSLAERDVALVKTEAVALATFDIASSEGQAGDDVYVLGSPLGENLAYTVTRGVLSGTREVQRQRWLQSDVRVLPGSSGGPMVGRTGAVLGITSRGLADGGAGVNFFVPIGEALVALRIEFQAP